MKKSLIILSISGGIAWIVSVLLASYSFKDVNGATVAIVAMYGVALLYTIIMLLNKHNRTVRGYINVLIGLFVSIALSCASNIILFFPCGEYVNYGLKAIYLYLIILSAPLIFTGIIITHLNQKQQK